MTARLAPRRLERRRDRAAVLLLDPDRLAGSPDGAGSSQFLAREPSQRANRGVDPALVESRTRSGRRSRRPTRVPSATTVPAKLGLANQRSSAPIPGSYHANLERSLRLPNNLSGPPLEHS